MQIPATQINAAGGRATLFDSTLGSDTASIDTGAAGIAGGYNILDIYVIGYTSAVAASDNIEITFNNDGSANYDYITLYANNTTVAGAPSLAQVGFYPIFHGSGGSGAYPSVLHMTMANYAGTTFLKTGNALDCSMDATAGNVWTLQYGIGYRSTSAISRMKVAGFGGPVLKSGTRLLIYGLL